jgi:hypothetical protein
MAAAEEPGPPLGASEETPIRLTSLVSARLGRRGRRRLAAWLAGARAPNTLAALALGGQKAARAVAHTMLVIAYHLLREGTCDEEER